MAAPLQQLAAVGSGRPRCGSAFVLQATLRGFRRLTMKTFIAAVVIAGIFAIAAGNALDKYLLETSKAAYSGPSVRI